MSPFEQEEPPQVLRELRSNAHALSNEFMKNIRLYNAALSYCSISMTRDVQAFSGGQAPSVFQLHSAVYHHRRPLQHAPDTSPVYAQLYFYDPATATDVRFNRNSTLSRELFSLLSTMCDEHSQFSRIYRRTQELGPSLT